MDRRTFIVSTVIPLVTVGGVVGRLLEGVWWYGWSLHGASKSGRIIGRGALTLRSEENGDG